MRLSYLQLRSFYLRFVFFTYGGGTVGREVQIHFLEGGSCKRKDQTQFPDRENRKQKRPNRFSTVSKKDLIEFLL